MPLVQPSESNLDRLYRELRTVKREVSEVEVLVRMGNLLDATIKIRDLRLFLEKLR
ncbi:MAG: hypothetical protein AAFX93_19065 [Verrucomicrobiota bacterium]